MKNLRQLNETLAMLLERYRGFNFGAHLLLDGVLRSVAGAGLTYAGWQLTKKVSAPDRPRTRGELLRGVWQAGLWHADGRKASAALIANFLQDPAGFTKIANRHYRTGVAVFMAGASDTVAQLGATLVSCYQTYKTSTQIKVGDVGAILAGRVPEAAGGDVLDDQRRLSAIACFLGKRMLDGQIQCASEWNVAQLAARLLPGRPQAAIKLSQEEWATLFQGLLLADGVSVEMLDAFWERTPSGSRSQLLSDAEAVEFAQYYLDSVERKDDDLSVLNARLAWLVAHFAAARQSLGGINAKTDEVRECAEIGVQMTAAYDNCAVQATTQHCNSAAQTKRAKLKFSETAGANILPVPPAKLALSESQVAANEEQPAPNFALSRSVVYSAESTDTALASPVKLEISVPQVNAYRVQPLLEDLLLAIRRGLYEPTVWESFLNSLITNDGGEVDIDKWSALLSVKDACQNNLLHCISEAFAEGSQVGNSMVAVLNWLRGCLSERADVRYKAIFDAFLQRNADGDTPLHLLEGKVALARHYRELLFTHRSNYFSFIKLLSVTDGSRRLFVKRVDQQVINCFFDDRGWSMIFSELSNMLCRSRLEAGGWAVDECNNTLWHRLASVPKLFLQGLNWLKRYNEGIRSSCDVQKGVVQVNIDYLTRSLFDRNRDGDIWLHVFVRNLQEAELGKGTTFRDLCEAMPGILLSDDMLLQLNYRMETPANLWHSKNSDAFAGEDSQMRERHQWASVSFGELRNTLPAGEVMVDGNKVTIRARKEWGNGDAVSLTLENRFLKRVAACNRNFMRAAIADGGNLDFVVIFYLLLYQRSEPEMILDFFSGHMRAIAVANIDSRSGLNESDGGRNRSGKGSKSGRNKPRRRVSIGRAGDLGSAGGLGSDDLAVKIKSLTQLVMPNQNATKTIYEVNKYAEGKSLKVVRDNKRNILWSIVVNSVGDNWLHLLIRNMHVHHNELKVLLGLFYSQAEEKMFERCMHSFNNAGITPIGVTLHTQVRSVQDGNALVALKSDTGDVSLQDGVQSTVVMLALKDNGGNQRTAEVAGGCLVPITQRQIDWLRQTGVQLMSEDDQRLHAQTLWENGDLDISTYWYLSGLLNTSEEGIGQQIVDNLERMGEVQSLVDFCNEAQHGGAIKRPDGRQIEQPPVWLKDGEPNGIFGQFLFGRLPFDKKVTFMRKVLRQENLLGKAEQRFKLMVNLFSYASKTKEVISEVRRKMLLELAHSVVSEMCDGALLRLWIQLDAKQGQEARYLKQVLQGSQECDAKVNALYGELVNEYLQKLFEQVESCKCDKQLPNKCGVWVCRLLTIWVECGCYPLSTGVLNSILQSIELGNSEGFFAAITHGLSANDAISPMMAASVLQGVMGLRAVSARLANNAYYELRNEIKQTARVADVDGVGPEKSDRLLAMCIAMLGYAKGGADDDSVSVKLCDKIWKRLDSWIARVANQDCGWLLEHGLPLLHTMFTKGKMDSIMKDECWLAKHNPIVKLAELVVDRRDTRAVMLIKKLRELDSGSSRFGLSASERLDSSSLVNKLFKRGGLGIGGWYWRTESEVDEALAPYEQSPDQTRQASLGEVDDGEINAPDQENDDDTYSSFRP